MSRYQQIIRHLDTKPPSSLRICEAKICACMGCVSSVGGKQITQDELDLYLSGQMRVIVNTCDHCKMYDSECQEIEGPLRGLCKKCRVAAGFE